MLSAIKPIHSQLEPQRLRSTNLRNEIGVHDHQQAEHGYSNDEISVLQRRPDARSEQLRQHPGQPSVDAEVRLLGVHLVLSGRSDHPSSPARRRKPTQAESPILNPGEKTEETKIPPGKRRNVSKTDRKTARRSPALQT